MDSTRRPLAVVAAGVALTVVSGMATLSAGLDASARAGSGPFAVADHDGMAPGGVPALVLLLGLLLIGVGAAMHDGRRLRTAERATVSTAHAPHGSPAPVPAPAAPQVVHVITSLPPRAAAPRATAPPATHARRTSSGARIELVELVGTSRRS